MTEPEPTIFYVAQNGGGEYIANPGTDRAGGKWGTLQQAYRWTKEEMTRELSASLGQVAIRRVMLENDQWVHVRPLYHPREGTLNA